MTSRLLAGCALLLLLACEPQATEQGLSRSDFVATYVDLRRATVAGEMDDATRDSILDAHGTTADELREYVEARADDPQAIADTWREVMDSISARDTVVSAPDRTTPQPDSL